MGKSPPLEGTPVDMAENAAQWGRHAAFTADRAAKAAEYAVSQSMTATNSAQNAVSSINYLMNHPDLRSSAAAAASLSPAITTACTVALACTQSRLRTAHRRRAESAFI